MREYRSNDGTRWRVDVRGLGASNAMIVFHHPAGKTSRLDRYAWEIWNGPESRNVTSRVTREKVMQSLDDESLQRLFRRSMPISNPRPLINRAS